MTMNDKQQSGSLRKKSILSMSAAFLYLLALLALAPISVSAKTGLKAPKIAEGISGEGYGMVVWEPVKGADGYEVWQKKNGSFVRVASPNGRHHVYYSNHKAVPGKAYSYRIRAVGSGGRKSAFSKTVKLRIRLATPVIRSLKKRKISWYRVRGATRYAVYMKKSKSGKWKRIGSTTGTSLTIRKKYRSRKAYYTVRAFRGSLKSGIDPGFTRKEKTYSSKKILFEGDSITYPYYSWARRTARALGMHYTDRARNASRITDSVSSIRRNIYRRSMKRGFKGYDIIVIAAGTNDWGNSIRLGKKKDTNPESFYGAYRAIIKKAKKTAPKAVIVLCLPMDRGRKDPGHSDILGTSYENKQGRTLEKYRSAVRYLARQYDCLVYDMASAGVNSRKSAVEDTFDLLHPNYRTHIRISQDFKKFLKKHVLSK